MTKRNVAFGRHVIAAALIAAVGGLAEPAVAAERVVLMESFVVTC